MGGQEKDIKGKRETKKEGINRDRHYKMAR